MRLFQRNSIFKWLLLLIVINGFALPRAASAMPPINGTDRATDRQTDPATRASEPTPELPDLSEEESQEYLAAATKFNNPEGRPVMEGNYTINTLLEEPFTYDGYQVDLQGKIVQMQRLNDLPLEGWEEGVVLTIAERAQTIQVIYRGSLYQLELGADIHISGVFVAEGSVVHADLVYADVKGKTLANGIPGKLLLAGGIVLLLGIGALVALILPKCKKAPMGMVFLLVLLIVSACEIQMDTQVRPDGKVTTIIRMAEKAENVDFLREVPGLDGYFDAVMAQMRITGSKIANWVDGDEEFFFVQNDYPSIQAFLEQTGTDQEPGQESWVYLKTYQQGEETCYRFQGVISPAMLYQTPQNTEQTVVNEIEDMVEDIDMTYNLTLPGRILYSNAAQLTANRVKWEVDMQEENTLIAQSCYVPPAISGMDWGWAWLAISGAGLVDLALWTFAILKLHKNETRKDKNLEAAL